MLIEQQEPLLADHTDMRVVPLDADETPADRNRIVQLSPDHPGFRDPEYRARRNRIAQLALSYQPGQQIHPRNTRFGGQFGRRSAPRIWRMRARNTWRACGSWPSRLIAFRSYAK